MSLQNVPLFGLGNTGKSLPVNAQKRTNLYVEIQQDPEANGLVMYPTPGLTTFYNFGANPTRGAYAREGSSVIYIVNSNTLWEVAPNGVATSRGTLLTSGGRVDMIDNGTQLLIVDGQYGYIYTFATTTLAQITAPGFIAADTCAFLNGYFVVQRTSSGQFAVSGSYNGTTWDALDFATAESDPDNLVRVIADSGQVVLFGEKTTEFWGDSGAADFPLARIGASAIQWGLAARWSLARFMNSLVFLGKNQLGAVQVFMLSNGGAVPISNPELDFVISTYSATADATGFSYMLSGHPMYCINFPTAGESWEYDGLTKEWHRRMSGSSGRYRGEIQVGFLGKSYVTDYQNGKLYRVDQTVFTDDGTPIVREFVSRHNKAGDYLRISKLWLEMEAGVGLSRVSTPSGAAPPAGTYPVSQLDSLYSFTRASTATFVSSDGLLKTAAVNAPRIAYNPSTLAQVGLLIEGAATNLNTFSGDLTNAVWNRSAGCSASTSAVVAADGTSLMTNVSFVSTGDFIARDAVGGVSLNEFQTHSFFVKKNVGSTFFTTLFYFSGGTLVAKTASFNFDTGVASNCVFEPWANGIYRVIITLQNNGTPNTSRQLNVQPAAAGTSLYIWGSQLELGSTATSYIPTTSVPVTRAADVATPGTVVDQPGSNPQLMMQISRDGGKTYGNEVWRPIGKIGQNRARAVFNSLGRARDWVFKFRVTDPVETVFIAAWASYAK